MEGIKSTKRQRVWYCVLSSEPNQPTSPLFYYTNSTHQQPFLSRLCHLPAAPFECTLNIRESCWDTSFYENNAS